LHPSAPLQCDDKIDLPQLGCGFMRWLKSGRSVHGDEPLSPSVDLSCSQKLDVVDIRRLNLSNGPRAPVPASGASSQGAFQNVPWHFIVMIYKNGFHHSTCQSVNHLYIHLSVNQYHLYIHLSVNHLCKRDDFSVTLAYQFVGWMIFSP
jgi:hypothetical protein